jgi:biopolymer transport protein ExbD
VKLQSPTSVQLSLEQQGRVVHQLAIDAADFEQLKSRISTSVGQVQSSLLSQNPEAEMSARLIPTASVDYGSMIAVLDILKGYGISALAVVPVRE